MYKIEITNRNNEELSISPFFEEYLVPVNIMKSHENADMVDLLLKFRRKRMEESTYFEAYSTMLYYEEATEMSNYQSFDVKDIQLERSSLGSSSGRYHSKYRFKIDVIHHFILNFKYTLFNKKY